jgi:carboxypeptidase C (cathepsin A)
MPTRRSSALAAAAAAAAVAATTAAPPGARVTSLPGVPTMPPFALYSGYIPVPALHGATHNLFYLLVESASATPDADPLVIWNTGGPGCSSLYAFATEHGALLVNPDGASLRPNPYSWNARANMLYVESPVCVGFSTASDGNCTTGDDAAAADMAAFVAGFVAAYPEFANRPLFLSGESYSGHYTPQLAALLHASPPPGVNLRGFLVGNPSFEGAYDGGSYWWLMASHGLVSTAEFGAALATCNGTFVGPQSPACAAAVAAMRSQIPYTNPYNILAPCDGPPSLDGSCFTAAGATGQTGAEALAAARVGSQTVVPCMNVTPGVAYFNLPAVRAALHVAPDAHAWDVCSSWVNYTQYAPTVRPEYLALKDAIDILVYSGDVDSCVPFLGTQAGIDSLGWAVDTAWDRWWVTDDAGLPQIAGYVRTYASATGRVAAYATIKGAGHMAPGPDIGRPAAALALLNAFLDGGKWPPQPPGA